jgi:hypothetical protein
MHEQQVDFQLAPPHVHCRNAAERAIRTFSNHFTSILCGTNPTFPLHLWDKLLPQCEMTLNLLRGSRINPKLSAYAQLHGAFDYNKTPLALPGTKVVIHEKPSIHQSHAHMVLMAITLVQPWNIIAVTESMQLTLELNTLPTLWPGFHHR